MTTSKYSEKFQMYMYQNMKTCPEIIIIINKWYPCRRPSHLWPMIDCSFHAPPSVTPLGNRMLIYREKLYVQMPVYGERISKLSFLCKKYTKYVQVGSSGWRHYDEMHVKCSMLINRQSDAYTIQVSPHQSTSISQPKTEYSHLTNPTIH